MMTTRHEQPHYHVNVVQLGEIVYDQTDLMPVELIKQFSALAAMVDGNEYKQVAVEVAKHFLKAQQEGQNPYYLLVGEFMAEGVFKCTNPCYVSPSMN